MSNMSYCRFHNTNQDFADCIHALEDMRENFIDEVEDDEEIEESNSYSNLSDMEKTALKSLMEMCDQYKELAEELLEDNE